MQLVEEKPLSRVYDAGLVRWVWQFIRPYQGLFWLATFLMPLDTGFLLAQPYVIKLTVDEFLSGAHGAPPPAWLALLFRHLGRPRPVRIGRVIPAAGRLASSRRSTRNFI